MIYYYRRIILRKGDDFSVRAQRAKALRDNMAFTLDWFYPAARAQDLLANALAGPDFDEYIGAI
jgi:hypothetical protein